MHHTPQRTTAEPLGYPSTVAEDTRDPALKSTKARNAMPTGSDRPDVFDEFSLSPSRNEPAKDSEHFELASEFPNPPSPLRVRKMHGDQTLASDITPSSTRTYNNSLSHEPSRIRRKRLSTDSVNSPPSRTSLDRKPLPPQPTTAQSPINDPTEATPPSSSRSNDLPINLSNIHRPHPDLDKVLDLTNTADTTVAEKFLPAVTHETVHKEIHHIREEHITREFHNHDVFHRVLPVIDVEVLPPRHFLPVEGGGLMEVDEDEIPGRANKQNWVIAETISKPRPPFTSKFGGESSYKPRQFTAREFHGTEGSRKKYRAPEGHKKTERTWVHPPELETVGQLTGQTWPIHFWHGEDGKLEREPYIEYGPDGPDGQTMAEEEEGLRRNHENVADDERREEILNARVGKESELPVREKSKRFL